MPMPDRIFTSTQRRGFPYGKVISVTILFVALGGAGYWWFTRPSTMPISTLPALNSTAPLSPQENPVDAAKAKFEAGDLDAARARLKPILEAKTANALLPQAILLQAELERAAGNGEQVLALLKRCVEEFPASPEQPIAAARYALLLDESGKGDEALALFERVRSNAPAGMRAAAIYGLGKRAERAGRLIEAQEHYQDAVRDAKPNTKEWNDALDALGNVNIALIFAPGETPDSKFYAVEKGDSINLIGMKLNTTQGLLIRANNIEDPAKLRLGQRLKHTPKDFRIIVERSTCRLFLIDNDGLFKRYFVGLGMPGYETTLGNYTMGNKQKDPTWFKPGGGPIPPNDPANELGTRWMPLVPNDPGLPTDLGIHGTIAPETIGQYKSHGCPRMKKEDVEELYDLVVRATPVTIVDTIDWSTVFTTPPAATVAAGQQTEPPQETGQEAVRSAI